MRTSTIWYSLWIYFRSTTPSITFFMNIMIVDLNMAGVGKTNHIFCQHNRTSAITKYLNFPLYSNSNIFEQHLYPHNLTSSLCNNSILQLCLKQLLDVSARTMISLDYPTNTPFHLCSFIMLYLMRNLHHNITQEN